MNTEQFKQFLITMVASLGGIGIILGAVFAWLGRIWIDQIYLKTSFKNQKELDTGRDISTERRDLINSLLAIISNQRSRSYEKINTAVELVWGKTLELREKTKNYIFIYLFLDADEMKFNAEKISLMTPDLSMEDFANITSKIANDVEKVRPFIGENLWELYSVYHAFLGRLSWKIINGKVNHRYFAWDVDENGKRDDFLLKNLKTIFTNEELRILSNEKEPVRTITKILEIRILEEMNKLAIGSEFINKTLDEYIKLASVNTSPSPNK